jgi:hypothetical protein
MDIGFHTTNGVSLSIQLPEDPDRDGTPMSRYREEDDMYANPIRALSFLISRELVQICIGRYEVILKFDGNTAATILGRFTLDDQDLGQLPDAARHLLPLLGSKIAGAKMFDGVTRASSFRRGVRFAW